MNSYTELKEAREQRMGAVSMNHIKLNLLHDELIAKAVHLALDTVRSERGNPPAPFAFFLMGSAGRFEQSVWSDQDHGIIFAGNDDSKSYFLRVGAEITNALAVAGYEPCDGKVMASNPLWCKSVADWQLQVADWLEEASWQSLRHFSTFFDSRVLVGEKGYLKELKQTSFSILQDNPDLYIRLIDNVDFLKKGVGIFGQLLPEQQGEQSGTIQLKQKAFFPYVNALRLLALKNKIFAPSTLSRFRQLTNDYQAIKSVESDFIELLDYRLKFRKNAQTYEEVHLIPMQSLNKEAKQELKQLMKKGYKLFSDVKSIIEKECSK